MSEAAAAESAICDRRDRNTFSVDGMHHFRHHLANYRIIASGAVRLGELKGCKHVIEGSVPAGLACAGLFLHTGAW